MGHEVGGTLRRIEDVVNNTSKDYSNIRVVPRGSQVFIDENLRGRVRFGQRRGNFLPVLEADNQSELAAEIVPPTTAISLTRVRPGFEILGAVISVAERELATIFDIDASTGEVVTTEEITGSHEEGSAVNLYGVPIEVIGDQALGDNVIQVRSVENIVIGDQIAIETTVGLINSNVSILVTDTVSLGINLDGRFQYELTLDEGINRALVNEEDILLRGQMGYESLRASIVKMNGPFAVDFVSGPFIEGTVVDEFLNIQLFSAIGDAVAGFEQPVSTGKNFAVAAMPVRSDSMLFWKLVQGSVQFRDGKFIAITDEDGRFVLSQELVPPFQPNTEWEIPVRANDTTLLRVKFEPNEFRTFALGTNIPNRIQVGVSGTETQSTRLEIVAVSENPGSEIEFSNWLSTSPAISTLLYQITSTAFGRSVWQAGSLMLKPYFFTLDDVAARYDFAAYDNGRIHT